MLRPLVMDYSIFDAIRGGFGKLVFVIRKSFEQDFREKIVAKYENHIPVEVVFQDLNDLPAGFTCPEGRQKPWGTNHALLMGKDVIKEPFAVINADDFYGRDSFAVLGKWLSNMEGKQNQYCMVGYRVGNTLSESGSVARGVCETNAEGYLTGVVERTAIERIDGEIQFKDENGKKVVLEENTPVSMNMWGFTPDYFKYSEDYFVEFLKANISNLKCEYYIPNRLTDGYGLTRPAMEQLYEQGTRLLITVDSGITANEEIAVARELGMQVVITDHHECHENLPDAQAVVDCKRTDDTYPFSSLAGVGVAFKLICALEGDTLSVLDRYADLVALGTVADVMPIVGENRIIVAVPKE